MNDQRKITRRETLLATTAFAASAVSFKPARAQEPTPGTTDQSTDQQIGSLAGEVAQGIVKLPDSQIEYFSQGQGEAVVLLPGGSLAVGYLEELAQELANAGYRAVRVNPRGAGKSTGSETNITLHAFAADVAGVIRDLELGQAHMVGHAFGNRVARMLAADQSQLVRSVVLLAAGGMVEPKEPVQRALNTIFNPAASESELFEAMKYMVGDPGDPKEDPAKAWQILKPSLAPKAAGIQGTASKVTPLDAWWAPAGQQKYLVVQGSDDQAAPPENGQLLKEQLGERVKIVTISGAGHLMTITQPKKVASAIVSFLRE
jgi:pimeloyl-ACP methyl ester carboxylesterase